MQELREELARASGKKQLGGQRRPRSFDPSGAFTGTQKAELELARLVSSFALSVFFVWGGEGGFEGTGLCGRIGFGLLQIAFNS